MSKTNDCRNRLTAYLRNNRITYTACKLYVQIGAFFFHFDDQTDYIRISTPHFHPLSRCLPFAEPDTVFEKFLAFKGLVESFCRQRLQPYNLIASASPKKAAA